MLLSTARTLAGRAVIGLEGVLKVGSSTLALSRWILLFDHALITVISHMSFPTLV